MMCGRGERGVAGSLFLTEGLTPLVFVQPCALSLPSSPAPLASLAPALCHCATGSRCPPAFVLTHPRGPLCRLLSRLFECW